MSVSFIFTIFVFLTGNILDVTAFNRRPLLNYNGPGSSEATFFGGYKSGNDATATITLGRAIDTGTGPLTLPNIPNVVYYETALQGRAYRIQLKAAIGLQSIGAFHINASKDGVSHSMVTITMAQSGEFNIAFVNIDKSLQLKLILQGARLIKTITHT